MSMKIPAAEPNAVVVSIKKANGNSAYSMQKVELYNMNGYYISKPLSLLPGDYTVEQFFVVDAADNVMYASPLKGSPKAYLVSKPLPISFTVSKDKVTKLVPEVLNTGGSIPEDFGYSTFSFEVVKTFDFLIGIFVYNESTQNFELTTANLSIVAANKTIFTDTLTAITNKITLNEGYDKYILTVTKDSYKNWIDTLTATELMLYFNSEDKGPLKVILEKGCNCPPTVTDTDGNVYETVVIGTQCWMKENLKTTKYNDGTDIPLITDDTEWFNRTSSAFCWYNNDISNKNIYGGLYNWYAVNTGKLCPSGWHVPTDAEWTILTNYLGESVTGAKLKETGTIHWQSPNIGANNETGFTALPSGCRYLSGGETFGLMGTEGFWWSSTERDKISHWFRQLTNVYSNVNRDYCNGIEGFSVRCIKD